MGIDKVMNVIFIRVLLIVFLKVEILLIFLGEDVCFGIWKGGYIYIMMRIVKYRCFGDVIFNGIEVDFSIFDMGEKIFFRDFKVFFGIIFVKKDSFFFVCKVMGLCIFVVVVMEVVVVVVL